MSGRFNYAGRRGPAFPTPDMITVLVGKSTQIHAGDVLVATNNSTYSNGTVLVARPLLSGDTITGKSEFKDRDGNDQSRDWTAKKEAK